MIQVIALLYAGKHGIEGLRTFETQAITILREHQGTLVSASYNQQKGTQEPDEIHVIQFPTATHFHHYRNDPRTIKLADSKSQMIRHMQVYVTDVFYEY